MRVIAIVNQIFVELLNKLLVWDKYQRLELAAEQLQHVPYEVCKYDRLSSCCTYVNQPSTKAFEEQLPDRLCLIVSKLERCLSKTFKLVVFANVFCYI